MGAYQNNRSDPKKSRKKSNSMGNWGGYIDCPMGKAERDTFLAYAKSNVISPFDSMQNMIDVDINLSMSWSEKDQAYLAKATQESKNDGKRYMLSGFHSDLETAWLVLIYKHFVLLGEEWFPSEGEDNEEFTWG